MNTKTITLRLITAASLVMLSSVCPRSTLADESTTATAGVKQYSGTITAVDAKNRTVRVRGFLVSKTMRLGDHCLVSVGDKKEAGLSDLHPGQKVHITYKSAEGVLVATRIAQQPLRYRGAVVAIDPRNNTLTVEHGRLRKTFALARDCKFIVKDGGEGKREDVQIGHKVTVVYETPDNQPIARRIEQMSSTLVADLSAVDLTERTVKAKQLLGNKTLVLADDCKIVLKGKPDASLNDLRLGQTYGFSFNEVDGVNVVNRIASVPAPPVAETARSSK